MKKIKLNKVTVSTLNDEQMKKIYGATFMNPSCLCQDTKSCTFAHECCPPPELKNVALFDNNDNNEGGE